MKTDFAEARINERQPTRVATGEESIRLYLTRYGAGEHDFLAERYRALLSDEEKEQELRFYFAEDQRRYLLTRALVRTVLSRYSETDPRELRFRTNRWGKPEIANGVPREAGIHFNVSHTRGLIALAVTKSRALGVDVENVAARQTNLEIAERYFADAEISALRQVGEDEQRERFFTFWTLKEAYVKARGLGLSIPLDHFCFHLSSTDTLHFEPLQGLEDRAERWQFWLFRPLPDYLLALCAERSAGWTISAQWSVPLEIDDPAPLELLRRSP